WVTRIICAIYWFHPLVWFAAWQMRIERERACDDLVLATGMKPADYAEELVEIAATYRSPRWVTVSALAMARTSQLEDRLRCLLDSNRPRVRLSHRALSLLLAGGLSMATVVATAGKIVVRDKAGAKVGEIAIPKGGTVTLEETNAQANNNPQNTQHPVESGIQRDQRLAVNDWPMWGGTSHRNNVSRAKRIPLNWNTKQGENVRWSTQLGSVTYGGTVVAGDRIFVGTNNNAALVTRFPKTVDLGCLVCLDRKTGQFLWQHSNQKLPTGRVHDWPFLGIISTPCVSGDRLWYVTNRCEVVCLDVAGFRDGENDGPYVEEDVTKEVDADVVWKLDMMQEFGVSPHNVSACSPTTDGQRLFVITGNGTDASHINQPPKAPDVICLDRETGKILWQDRPAGQRTLHGSWSSPTYGIVKGQPMVLMGCGDGWVYAYDPAGDGNGHAKLLWKFDANPKDAMWRIGGQASRNPYVATPVIWEDKVYVRTGRDPEHGEGNADLWCIDPVKHLDGSDVSATQVFAVVAGKPIGAPLPPRRRQNLDKTAGEVEWPNSQSAVIWHFQKQDLSDNGQIEFEERFHRGLGSPAIADGLLFITDLSGLLFCLDANTGRCHWTYDLYSSCYGSPLIADGKVYVGDEDGDIAVFNLSKKMTLLSEITNESSTYCTPVACGETLYLVDKSHLYAIAYPPQEQDKPAPDSNEPFGDGASRSRDTTPPKAQPDAGVLWGEAVDGLRLGIRSATFAKHATKFRYGDWLRYEIWIRNESKETIHIPRDPRDYASPSVKNGSINLLGSQGWASFDIPIEQLDKATLSIAPQKAALLPIGGSVQAPILAPGAERGRFGPAPLALPPGKQKVFAEQSVYYLAGGQFNRTRRDGKTVRLSSATVEIEILPEARLQIRPVNELKGNWTRKAVDQDKSLKIVELESPAGNPKTEFVLSQNSEVVMDNHDITLANLVTAPGDSGEFRVDITLTPTAAKRIAHNTNSLTRQPDPTRRLAIMLDGKVLAAPRLFSAIEGKKIAITGNFTKAQADSLVEALNLDAAKGRKSTK
ncbi:MAG: PQQ-binding-like beta-propeller repeat protein, partial [Planctomycetaceae bacterium]|nr:PQQ-binding-like beta-propeller repeat protein [Planctomycetaceae bacterium]